MAAHKTQAGVRFTIAGLQNGAHGRGAALNSAGKRDMSLTHKDWDGWKQASVRAGGLATCFCTGKCRELGYCPNFPPQVRLRPRFRVKAWRTPNEDGKLRFVGLDVAAWRKINAGRP